LKTQANHASWQKWEGPLVTIETIPRGGQTEAWGCRLGKYLKKQEDRKGSKREQGHVPKRKVGKGKVREKTVHLSWEPKTKEKAFCEYTEHTRERKILSWEEHGSEKHERPCDQDTI